jgi:hypothetical protein
MGEINAAFDVLKERIPPTLLKSGGGRSEKLTKITVLHIAINYIRSLEAVLAADEAEEDGDAGGLQADQLIRNPLGNETRVAVVSKSPEDISGHKGGLSATAEAPFAASSSGYNLPVMASDSGKSSPTDSGTQEGEDCEYTDDDIEECPDWTELYSSLGPLRPPTPLKDGLLPFQSCDVAPGITTCSSFRFPSHSSSFCCMPSVYSSISSSFSSIFYSSRPVTLVSRSEVDSAAYPRLK